MAAGEEEQAARGCLLQSLVRRTLVIVVVALAARKFVPRGKTDATVKKIAPFTLKGDGWKLSAAQNLQLEAGKKVLFTGKEAGAAGGRGTAVVDVACPPSFVWKTILDFDHYKGRLPQCKYSAVYARKKKLLPASESIKVHMKLEAVVRDFNCYYDHIYKPDQRTITWTLDPDKPSEFLDVQGQWVVDKHPTKPDWSRVWYSAEVLLPPWLPRVVVVQLCKTSGAKATGFAKKYSEAEYKTAAKGGLMGRLRGGILKARALPLTPRFAKR